MFAGTAEQLPCALVLAPRGSQPYEPLLSRLKPVLTIAQNDTLKYAILTLYPYVLFSLSTWLQIFGGSFIIRVHLLLPC